MDYLGLVETMIIQEEFERKEGITIIEKIDFTKYTVGREKTHAFLNKNDGDIVNTAHQIFVLEHKGQKYSSIFMHSTLTFDDPEARQIIHRIIQSFKFQQCVRWAN